MAGPIEIELLKGARTSIQSPVASKEEAMKLLEEGFPGRSYCLVEDWTIFRADLTPDELEKVHAANHLPLFVFSQNVIHDSRGRFPPGGWVRSTMCVGFDDGVMFETKNTIYVLIGLGHGQTASLQTIFSFFE